MNADIYKAHSYSKEGVNPVLNIFKVPRTDISINDCRFSTFSPVGKSITPIQFDLPAMQEFVDLSRSYFTIRLKLAMSDGNPIKTTDDLFLVNNLPHSMIKQFGVRLNGTLINPHTDTYPYKAMIETILNYDREDGKTILRPQGWVNALDLPKAWVKTASGNMDIKISSWSDNQKAGFKLLKAESGRYFNDSSSSLLELRLKIRPHVEPFWFPYVLKPGVQMQFEVHFHDPKFWTMVADDNTKKLRFTEADVDMRFHLARLKLNDSIYNDLMLKTQNNAQKAVYPVVRSELRTFIWNSDNQLRFEEEDIFNGKVPQRVVLAIVDSKSFNGTKNYYPFSFLKAKIKYIKQIIQGEEYPYETLELTQDDRYDYDGYYRFLQASGALIKSQPNMLREEDWGEDRNCNLFMWNNVGSGNADTGMMNPNKKGNVRIEIEAHSAPGFVSTVLVYGEFENLVTIDSMNDVEYNIYQ